MEASVAWGALDFYIEAEYVRDSKERLLTATITLGESSAGRPVEWLRIGGAGQRTRIYGGDRNIQLGPFAQVTWGPRHDRRRPVQPGVERADFRRHDRLRRSERPLLR